MKKRFYFIQLSVLTIILLLPAMGLLLLPAMGMAGTVNGLTVTPIPITTAVQTPVRTSQKPSTSAVIAMGRSLGTTVKPILPKKSSRMTRKSLSTAKPKTIISRRANGTPRQIKISRGQHRSTQSITPLTSATALSRARAFMNSVKADLRLHQPDKEMAFMDFHTDRLHRSHARFSQQYKGIPVWPANLNVHFNQAGEIDLIDGAYIPTPRRLVTRPVINADSAVTLGRAAVTGGDKGIVSAPELIVYAPGDQRTRLAWKMKIAISITENWLVVIDAADGRVLDAYTTIKTGSLTGSGADLQGNIIPLSIWNDGQKNYLIDTSKNMYNAAASTPPAAKNVKGGIIIMDMGHNELPHDGGSFNVNYVTSTSTTSGWIPDGVSLAHSLSLVYDYYEKQFGWKSFDNKGSTLMGMVRVNKNFENAFWSSAYNAFFFGDAKPFAAALDVVGHEFTHGVTSSTCNLVYRDQPGALNEALSDIFGEAVEAFSTGSTDWIDGTVFHEASSRNLKDPSSVIIVDNARYPATMSQFYGPDTAFLNHFQNRDNGGVHINMTIVSHCFYLLSDGLQGAIGIVNAAKIFHRAQTVHLTANGQFIDARLACITSAEELFGKDSVQAQKTAEAFDQVEITDNPSTPPPAPAPAISAEDSAVFVNYSDYYENYYLGRKETALGDPTYITYYPVSQARASVTGDGSTVFFVDGDNDACFQDTNATGEEQCLNVPGTISSVAMSADGVFYAFITLDDNGYPTNNIIVYNLKKDTSQTYTLQTPAADGEALNTVDHADSMVFTADGNFLIYDAYNLMRQQDGTEYGSWSIYGLELATGHIYTLIKPVQGFDIGFPSVGSIHPNLLTFDLVDKTKNTVTVMLMDLSKGTANPVVQLNSDWAVPTFTGDDKAIIYSKPDTTVATGYSLMRQPIDLTTFKPQGNPTLFQSDADFGVVYRRGTFVPPTPDIAVTPAPLSFGNVPQQSTKTLMLTLKNKGSSELRIASMQLTGDDVFSVQGSWAGLVLPAGASNALQISFTPGQATTDANKLLTINSNDPDTPQLSVLLTGKGITQASHTITVSHEGNGFVIPDGAVVVDEGNNQIFSFVPSSGSHIADVLMDQISVGSPSTYTATTVSTDHTLHVIFAADLLSKKGDVNKDTHINSDDTFDILKLLTGQIIGNIDAGASIGENQIIGLKDAIYVLQHNEITSAVTYTITASAGSNGIIFPSGVVNVSNGADQQFTMTPDSGYHIADLIVDGVSVKILNAHTFGNISGNHTISVSFAKDVTVPTEYQINAGAGTHGAITPSGIITVKAGGNETFNFTPDKGYEVANVTINGQSMGASTAYTFSNVQGDQSIVVAFKVVNQGNTTNDVEMLLSEAAGGRYDADELMDDVLDIAAQAILMARKQNGSLIFTGTLTQVGSDLNFTYNTEPADKMVVAFTNGNHFEIKTDATKFSGYTNGSLNDFLDTHSYNVDFTIVSNTGISLRLISQTWFTDSDDPVYDMSILHWQRRIVGTYPDGERLINMDLTSQGRLRRSDPSASRVFSEQTSTLTGTASSGGNIVTLNEQFEGEFSHDGVANQEVKRFNITNNSKITMGANTYKLNNYQVNWIMGGSLNQQAVTPFIVIESEKWSVSGQVLHNNQSYGSIAFSSQPVNNTKGPAVILNRLDNTSVDLFRPIN